MGNRISLLAIINILYMGNRNSLLAIINILYMGNRNSLLATMNSDLPGYFPRKVEVSSNVHCGIIIINDNDNNKNNNNSSNNNSKAILTDFLVLCYCIYLSTPINYSLNKSAKIQCLPSPFRRPWRCVWDEDEILQENGLLAHRSGPAPDWHTCL